MKKNKMPLKERLFLFMQGRNGPDELYSFLVTVTLILLVVNIFFSSWIIVALLLAITAISIWRFLSKNLYKRRQENASFLRIKRGILDYFRLCRDRFRDRKTHVYRRCPNCKKVLRLPRRPGHHNVCCPCCSHRFEVKISGSLKKQK
jgi:predicted membrane metal-binding protein